MGSRAPQIFPLGLAAIYVRAGAVALPLIADAEQPHHWQDAR